MNNILVKEQQIESDESTLIEGLLCNSNEAFEVVVRKYHKTISRLQTHTDKSPDFGEVRGQWNLVTPDQILSCQELSNVITDSIKCLPALQQAVLSLNDIEGMESKEICSTLDINHGNFRVLLHRARKCVHDAIDEYQNCNDEEPVIAMTKSSDDNHQLVTI